MRQGSSRRLFPPMVGRVGRAEVMAWKKTQSAQIKYPLEAWRAVIATEVPCCDLHFSHVICFHPPRNPKRYNFPHFIDEDTKAQRG